MSKGASKLRDAWTGVARLNFVFWGMFVLPALLLVGLYVPLFVAFITVLKDWSLATMVMLALPVPWFAATVVCVFRCKDNCGNKVFGPLAMAAVGLFVVTYFALTMLFSTGLHGI